MGREEGRTGLPSGTVTFLFTDIEGSTPLWEQHPAAMQAAVARHDEVVRAAVRVHGGAVFSTAGDAFAAAFHTPGDAVAAALAAQRALQVEAWPQETSIRVRMGVHTGAAQERDGDYFGAVVNRAARLMGLAHGGQVLVSLAVEELVRDELPDGVQLLALGVQRLRGLSRPEQVFQLGAPDVSADFPPLAAPAAPGNLPSPPTSFVGRAEELEHLADELANHRLVTLVGPGGVGKTRLSIEAAAVFSGDFPGGVWLVELAQVAGPDAVLHAVTTALAVPPEAGTTPLGSLVAALSGRRVLVVLDNCEHVAGAAAKVADEVGRGAPTTTILATSREPLGVAGERLVDVATLDPDEEAAELFVERAAAAVGHFEPTDAELDTIRHICRRLDGMPLAIELAASRARSMSLGQLADRLADGFRVLSISSSARIVEQRHQTLRAAVTWSYQLLGAAEQRLFDRLSVFAGTFDPEAAETVCGPDPLDTEDLVELLGSLVDRSLVLLDRKQGRYRLLETLREYGAEQLAARGEVEVLRARHADHYAELARRARNAFEGVANAPGRELFEQEWDNLRAALDYSESGGAWRLAAGMVRDTWWYAWTANRDEHGRWAERRTASDHPDAWSIAAAGMWAWARGEYLAAEELGHRAVAAAGAPDHPDTALGWYTVCSAALFEGRREQALTAQRAAQAAAERAAPFNVWITAFPTPLLGVDPAEATALVDAARRRTERLGNDTIDAVLAFYDYLVSFGVGDRTRALSELRRAAKLAARAEARGLEAAALGTFAAWSPAASDEDPTEQFGTAIARLHEGRFVVFEYVALTGLAAWWADTGHVDGAACVLGFLERHDPIGNQRVADLRRRAVDLIDADPNVGLSRAEGGAMSADEIVSYCLERLAAHSR